MSMEYLPIPTYAFPVLSFLLTCVILFTLIRRYSHRVLDHPNERSLHDRPVPRTGGIGVVIGIASTVPFVSPTDWWPLWLGAAVLVGTSFVDDVLGVPVLVRLTVHFLVAGIFMSMLSPVQPDLSWWLIAAITVVAIVWMINLYNFMDGMDGLAGGMAVFGFGFLGVAAWLNGNVSIALVSASIASAAGAFLIYNFYPARIFLGDAGSTTLGFLAAGMAVIGWREDAWSLWFPVVVFSPFIMDATMTLLNRILKGERFWLAHRSHCYQRLVLSGWGQRETAFAEYVVMCFCGLTALAYQRTSEPHGIVFLLLWFTACILLIRAVGKVQVHQFPNRPL